MSDELKQLILDKRKEGKLVHTTIEGFVSVDISEFIKQPADGILYDLNRLEEVVLTFINDPKWVNDFAVALTVRALKAEIEPLHELFLMAFRYWMGEEFGPVPTDKEMYTKLAEIKQRKTYRVAGE